MISGETKAWSRSESSATLDARRERVKKPEASRAAGVRSRRALVSPRVVLQDSKWEIDAESEAADVDQECPGVTLKSPRTIIWYLSFRLSVMVGTRLARSSCCAREQWWSVDAPDIPSK